LDIVSQQRTDSGRTALANDDHLGVDAVLAKQSLFLGDPHGAVKRAYRAEA
jgi:hypothetical protein